VRVDFNRSAEVDSRVEDLSFNQFLSFANMFQCHSTGWV
jgi:hypothetical protein